MTKKSKITPKNEMPVADIVNSAEDELRRVKEALEAANRDLQTSLAREKYLTRADILTGINNRRTLYELADHEFDVALRYQHPLAVILFDLDDFKQINADFGHATGDRVLERVTQVACAELRSADVIGRYGGEEFVVLLPVTNAQQAQPVAERIRAGVAAIRLPTEPGRVAVVTASLGIAEIRLTSPQDETVEDIIRRAEQALSAAKQAGKNRVVKSDK